MSYNITDSDESLENLGFRMYEHNIIKQRISAAAGEIVSFTRPTEEQVRSILRKYFQ